MAVGTQRIALCSCHCEELSAHLEMSRSTSVHIMITISVLNLQPFYVFIAAVIAVIATTFF